MTKFPNSLFLLLSLALLPFTMGGCTAAAVGAAAGGTVAYIRGDLEADISANMEQAREASADAIDKLGFTLISHTGDKLSAELRARTAQDDSVKIDLEQLTPTVTTITIRVGVFGDTQKAQRILDAVKQEL